MRFAELYTYAAGLPKPPVGFDFLRGQIAAHHHEIGRVDVYEVEYPTPTRQAYFRLGSQERTSPYSDAYRIAEIIHCRALKADVRELRYALTKEMMHIFDAPEAVVNTREKFEALLKEIQNRPLPADASAMMTAELDTRWMAAIILCPKNFRDQYVADYKAQKIAAFDIAEIFDVPEWIAPFVMDDYYDVAFAELVGPAA